MFSQSLCDVNGLRRIRAWAPCVSLCQPGRPQGVRHRPAARSTNERKGMAMGKFAIALIVALLIQPGSGATAPPQLADPGPTLYQRLGGYDAIAAVTDDFLDRLAHDKSLGRFFVGHSTDSVTRIRHDIVDFLCRATGGPCVYRGRDMKASHAGLG